MLLNIAERFAAEKSPLEAVRARLADDRPFDHALWQEMVDLGWSALTIEEADGGSHLTLAEAVVIIEALGRQLCATPLTAAIAAAELLKQLKRPEAPPLVAHLLSELAQGAQIALAVNEPEGDWTLDRPRAQAHRKGERLTLEGAKTLVLNADSAAAIIAIVQFEGSPHFIAIDYARYRDYLAREIVIDQTRRSFRLTLDGMDIAAGAILGRADAPVLQRMAATSALLLAAEMCGGLAGILNIVVDYLNTRRQFGRAIGSYQSLKHPSVDMLLGLEAARSHLYYAAGLEAGAEAEAEIAIHMAKAVAGEHFIFAADRAIQFHGAFGFTYDCDAQLYLRRALWCESQMGDASYHRSKLADLILSDGGK